MRKKRILDKYNGRKLEWLHDSFLFIVLMAAAVILFRFVIGMAIVRGDSMKPSLEDGTVVVYLRPVREYKPGDVVSVRAAGAEAPRRGPEALRRRCKARQREKSPRGRDVLKARYRGIDGAS